MNVLGVRPSLMVLRVVAIAALVCTLVASFVPLDARYRSFINGLAAGLLLGQVYFLFRTPRAQVQRLPFENTRS